MKKVLVKTINHSKSSNKKVGEWIHPDVVGIRFYSEIAGGNYTLKRLAERLGEKSLKCTFYSFEIKKEISKNNIREAFFQTVSNSSWANESYLVCSKIQEKFTKN